MEPEAPLPDISTIAASLDAELPIVPVAVATIPGWPFWAYVAAWFGAAGAAGYVLATQAASGSLAATEVYAHTVLGGAGLAVAGPIIALATWLGAYARSVPGQRAGLFGKAALRGGVSTFAGVTVWWTMLLVVDWLRLGTPW